MAFNSYQFILFFLPVMLIMYYALGRLKNKLFAKLFLLAASLFFYAYTSVSYLWAIGASVLVNYLLAYVIKTINLKTNISKKELLQKLLSYDNVQIYNIDADRNYTMNLDNYMDDGHYAPNGGTLMVDCIASGTYRITTDNIEKTLATYEEMAASFKWPFIKKNFSGELVKTLHQQLTTLGYPVNSGDIFGEITEQSIKDIQAQHGIDVSGIVFDDTQAVIDQMLNAK